MLFNYQVIDPNGSQKNGQIEALNADVAISSLQRRGMIVISVRPESQKTGLAKNITLFDSAPLKDIVIMSRQVSALFEAQVSAVKTFTLLAESTKNLTLKNALTSVAQDIQGGISLSGAMEKQPKVFSPFYVSMVRAGEESGKLTDTFLYLADYLERQYELTSKTRNALIYPAFVILTFIVVMVLMLTMVIPRLSEILIEAGEDIPFYTQIVIKLSEFFVNWGWLVLIFVIGIGLYFWQSTRSTKGKLRIDQWKISIPYIGDLYKKIYLARIADNINTMLSSGIPVVRTLEITGDVVDNEIYKKIMQDAVASVRAGQSISDAFEKHPAIPPIMVQMVQVGEETGSLGNILKTLARFYKREVDGAIDTLIGLIEPAMIILLGVGVGFLLTSILIPIYNIAGSL